MTGPERVPGKPGPIGNPTIVLQDAALDYAADVEAGVDPVLAWDRLRKAALRYATSTRRRGRPSAPILRGAV